MKTCPICGKEIINGVNGCQLQYECTECRPIHYPKHAGRHYTIADWNYIDYLEDKCLND